MQPLPQMRKAKLKEGLIPTLLRLSVSDRQKKSRKCGSQGKTGRKSDHRHEEKLPDTRSSG
jgi:hypothetical protein